MKIIFIIVSALAIIVLAYFFYLGYKSHNAKPAGLVKNQLTPCSKKPNCICTEYPNDAAHYAEPIEYTEETTDVIIQIIKTAINKTGGIIISHSETNTQSPYIAANYTSAIFKYVDDFEVRIDSKNKRIHLRSASRVGHSDMGVNLKRINNIKRAFSQVLKTSPN